MACYIYIQTGLSFPQLCRGDILKKIHEGHQGVTKCLERARASVGWPGITQDVKRLFTNCEHCQVHKPCQRREPLIPTPLPSGPWQRVAIDLCHFRRQKFLIVIDYYSRWIEILHVTSTTSVACIAKLKDIFARFGIPLEVVSDNGPQFASTEFRSFAAKYDFLHVTTSPFLPNANGEAERAVQSAKWILQQEDPWLSLLIYRDTVIAAAGYIPAQLMLGRHVRTTLPTLPSSLMPHWPNPDDVRQKDQETKSS